MTPKDYYSSLYKEHLQKFLKNSSAHVHNKKDLYVMCGDFWRDDLFAFIPNEQKHFFLYSFACDILHDELMFTYFKNDYQKFKSLTNYPKVEIGLTNIHIEPWWIAKRSNTSEHFSEFCRFYIEQMKEFHSKNKFHEASWENVTSALLKDQDIAEGFYGKYFTNELKTFCCSFA